MPVDCTCGHLWAIHDLNARKVRTACSHTDGPKGLPCGCKAYTAKEPVRDDPAFLSWRVGRKLGRTIYAVVGDEVGDADMFLGMMDTAELAALVVGEHNDWLAT